MKILYGFNPVTTPVLSDSGNLRSVHSLNLDNTGVASVSTALQELLNDPKVSGVVFNGVRGSLWNCSLSIPEGKLIIIHPGNIITGENTISGNGYIVADRLQQIFDLTVDLSGNIRTYNGKFSAKWYGANSTNTANAQPALQKAIDMCLVTGIRTLHFPLGQYRLDKGLLLYAANRQFHTLVIEGETTYWESGLGAELRMTYKNGFAIGMQMGKGNVVRNLAIYGSYQGMQQMDRRAYMSSTYEDWAYDGHRDNRYSPETAIVIDPFLNVGDLGSVGNEYPGWEDYYGVGGMSAQSGSTGTIIHDCILKNTVVGILFSPNGVTLNAENTEIRNIQFEHNMICIAGTQAQEKNNRIKNIITWGSVHTVFENIRYGNADPSSGNWYIDGVSVAGAVVRMFHMQMGGYFASYVRDIQGESLGSFGKLDTQLAVSVRDCAIEFDPPNLSGYRDLIQSDFPVNNLIFQNCNFRLYGHYQNMLMSSRGKFVNCYFTGMPVLISNSNASFENCNIYDTKLQINELIPGNKTANSFLYSYGGFALNASILAGEWYETIKVPSTPTTSLIWADASVTVTNINSRSFNFVTGNLNRYAGVGQMILIDGIYAEITGISGTTITCDHSQALVASGSYSSVHSVNIHLWKASFMGNCTGNTITNVVVDFGNSDPSTLVGTFHYSSYFQGGTGVFRIDSYNTGTKTFTVGGDGSFVVATGVYFGGRKELYNSLPNSQALIEIENPLILHRGQEIYERKGTHLEKKYVCTATGWLNPPDGDTRVATYEQIY